jgi:DNA replicative helicase MCM subunit Mcm2 (Cdc46/Mcm family)
MSTILSRFDLIFIVRDIRDEARDRSIARHVMGVHINAHAMVSRSRAKRAEHRRKVAPTLWFRKERKCCGLMRFVHRFFF